MNKSDHHEFEKLPLRAHCLLAGVPIQSLYRLDLPGGHEGMTLQEIADITGFNDKGEIEVGVVSKILFGLRGLIGRLFGWDDVPALTESVTYQARLSAEDYGRSQVKPGTAMGISRVLYRFQNEMLAEIVNRTVHCFWLLASVPAATGYTLYMAIYVKKLNWFTPIYMALITPMVKGIIYPAMLASASKRWAQAFPPSSDGLHPAGVM